MRPLFHIDPISSRRRRLIAFALLGVVVGATLGALQSCADAERTELRLVPRLRVA